MDVEKFMDGFMYSIEDWNELKLVLDELSDRFPDKMLEWIRDNCESITCDDHLMWK